MATARDFHLSDVAVIVATNDGRIQHLTSEAQRLLDVDAASDDPKQVAVGRRLEDLLGASANRDHIEISRAGGISERLNVRRIEAADRVIVLLSRRPADRPRVDEQERLLRLATLSEILPSLMHQVRNPLASATASLEVLVEELSSAELRQHLLEVVGEIQRAAQSLRGVGDMTRELRTPEAHSVDAALVEGASTVGGRARAQGVRLELAADGLPPVALEPSVIRAMVFHLVSNAISACPRGGNVRVVARVRDDAPRTGRRDFILVVEDDGDGMTEAERLHCCDLFFTTKLNGSGLGLPLCRHAVESAGGILDVSSSLGAGTRIEIVVPLAAGPR